MRNQLSRSPFVLLALFVLIAIACQEDSVQDQFEPIDDDVIAAKMLADNYLNASQARHGSESTIVILKYKKDQLYFHCTTGDGGYDPVYEETVTATVEPGEFIFWYSGGGVTDLEGIEFDSYSQMQLNDDPVEINLDLMWVIQVPEDYDDESGLLKYDIVYMHKGYDGPPIVLDPKIKVTH